MIGISLLAKRLGLILLLLAGLFAFALPSLARAPSPAAATTSAAPFDHFRTGFPLTGGHNQVGCGSCHQNGVFAGTPRRCASCHDRVRATGMPGNHVVTSAACDDCHTTRQWSITAFNHANVATRCASCHNGLQSSGKPANHLTTTADCSD